MAVEPAPPRPRSGWLETLFRAATQAAGVFVLAVVAALVVVLIVDAMPALRRAAEFQIFTSANWTPKPSNPNATPTFGALAFVYGTIVTSLIAMILAVPLGVASAAFLSEVASPTVRRTGAFLVELLAAIPSVVYGFWGIFVLAPAVQWVFTLVGGPNTGGNGLLSAGLILAIMVVPYITAIGFDVCQAVPRSQREGALALGATRWQTIWSVVLPYARPGLFAASFLALGRALGETMAVTMLVGNRPAISASPFALGDTIASCIANSLNEADSQEYRAAVVALALVLLAVTAGFNALARLILKRTMRGPRPGRASTASLVHTGAEMPAPPPLQPDTVRPPRIAATTNRLMLTLLATAFGLTVVPLFLILGYVTVRGAAALEPGLLTERGRAGLSNEDYAALKEARAKGEPPPLNDRGRPLTRGGVGHAMLGSGMIVGLATLFAVPLGLFAAIYLAETRNSRLANSVRFAAELLGGVPSIVIGIFAYALLVNPVWLGGRPWGASGFAGAAALAVMMIPILVRSAEESMKLVPDSLRQASLALGASRMQTTLRVVLPAALPAIVTGVFLAVGRIAGETAPLLLTAGATDYWPRSPATETPYLPYYIYTYSRSAYLDEREKAWAATLVLLAVVMVVNVGIRLLAGRRVLATRSD